MTSTTAEKTETPKFEQTMQGLLAMLQSLPRDGAVTNATLVDWLLPLFEDARDEYHSLASENSEQIAELTDAVDEIDAGNTPTIDAGTRNVVLSLVALLATAYQRAGWLNADATTLTPGCPKDLSEAFENAQTMVRTWASTVTIDADDEADDTGAEA